MLPVGTTFVLPTPHYRGETEFVVVDPECPTVANVYAWTRIRAEQFFSMVGYETVERVLVTPTDPVFLVVIYSTYPRLEMLPLVMAKREFATFREMCRDYGLRQLPVWLQKGF